MTLRDKILAIHYPQSAGQVPPCGYVLGHRHALDDAAELASKHDKLLHDMADMLDLITDKMVDSGDGEKYRDEIMAAATLMFDSEVWDD